MNTNVGSKHEHFEKKASKPHNQEFKGNMIRFTFTWLYKTGPTIMFVIINDLIWFRKQTSVLKRILKLGFGLIYKSILFFLQQIDFK